MFFYYDKFGTEVKNLTKSPYVENIIDEIIPPPSYTFLIDNDGAFIVDNDGAFLVEVN